MRRVVGRIGRAHGVHGLVTVEVRTDEPERRFAAGAVLGTDPVERGPLTVVGSRWHTGRLLVEFEELTDRVRAEELRGTELTVDVDPEQRPDADEEWYDHQLVGATAADPSGRVLGEVIELVHLPMQDVLVVRTPTGDEVLVPFVAAIVPVVDVAAGRLVLDPPGGLFEES